MSMMPIVDFIALANGSFEEGKRVERERIVAMLREEAAKVNRGIMGKPLDAASFALNLARAIEDGEP